MRTHYGLPDSDLRAACGCFAHQQTDLKQDVTCQACRRTLKFATRWFTSSTVEASALNSINIEPRNGART